MSSLSHDDIDHYLKTDLFDANLLKAGDAVLSTLIASPKADLQFSNGGAI